MARFNGTCLLQKRVDRPSVIWAYLERRQESVAPPPLASVHVATHRYPFLTAVAPKRDRQIDGAYTHLTEEIPISLSLDFLPPRNSLCHPSILSFAGPGPHAAS